MLKEQVRRTKIIWSFEAESLKRQETPLVDLLNQDFDALRLVYRENAKEFVGALKQCAAILATGKQRNTSLMIDVSEKVRARIEGLKDPVELQYEDEVSFVQGKATLPYEFEVQTEVWDSLFRDECMVYLGFGYVVLQAFACEPKRIRARVVQGGTVYPHMDLHVPETKPEPTLKDLDLDLLKEALKYEIDFLVVPGFSKRRDIEDLQKFCSDHSQNPPWTILKVNSHHVHEALPDLLPCVDGILISRMELALFMEPAMVPVLSKEMIQVCNDKSRIVFVASEMLGSMRHNATPTRAEVSDIANAVADGADGVVLSEDVSYGAHASRSIQLMLKIVEDMESKKEIFSNWLKHEPAVVKEMDAVAFGAYKTAQRVGAKAIVCLTKEGNTAVKLSSFRAPIPIIAVTFSEMVFRRLVLVRGVQAIVLNSDPTIDQVLPVVNDLLARHSWLKPGDKFVFVSVTLSSLGRSESNLFTIQSLVDIKA